MSREMKNGIVLMLLGIALVAVPFFLRMKDHQQSNVYMEAFEEEQDEKTEKSEKKKDALLLEESVIGIVEIPSLNIKYPIFEGTGNEALNTGIGHMESTGSLCEKGNCVLAGHNGSRHGAFFTSLCNVKLGAKVYVTNKAGVIHEYAVTEMKTVNPYDGWVTEDTEEEVLTLFTCADRGANRFVCKCVPVRKGGGA